MGTYLQSTIACSIQDHRIRTNYQLPVTGVPRPEYQNRYVEVCSSDSTSQAQTSDTCSELRVLLLRTTPYIYIHSTSFVP